MVTSGFVEFEVAAYGELAKPPRKHLRQVCSRTLSRTSSAGGLGFWNVGGSGDLVGGVDPLGVGDGLGEVGSSFRVVGSTAAITRGRRRVQGGACNDGPS
jgi:hypothetical protein